MTEQPDIKIPIQASARLTAAGPPNSTRHLCPLSTCSWYFDQPAAPAVDATFLADIFGPGAMMAQATRQHVADLERVLGEHFNRHTSVEFLIELVKQQELNRGLTRQLVEMSEALKNATARRR